MKSKRNKNLKQKGITLIALVVTIVVLLILAGITITMVFGDNGIIKTTQDAAVEYRAGTVEDEVTVWKSGKWLGQYTQTQIQSRDELIEDQKSRGLLTEEEAQTAKETGSVKIGSKTIDYGFDDDTERLVAVIGEGVGLTSNGKVVTLLGNSQEGIWTEVEIGEEITYINGVKKNYNNDDSYYMIDNNENVYAWGDNYNRQLGIESNYGWESSPTKLTGISNASDIYTANTLGIVKTTNGELYAWGYNGWGQLGIGNTENKTTPTKIERFGNVSEIYTSDRFVITKTETGELYAWGHNRDGQLGIESDKEYVTIPSKVVGVESVEKVYIYGTSSYPSIIAKTSSGELYSWGDNEYGKLGIGNTENKATPTKIERFGDVSEIYTSDQLVIAKTETGELYAWGYNNYGQLGIKSSEEYITNPTKIEKINNVSDVYISDEFVIAKKTTGDLWAWGYNEYGQLGIENSEEYITNPTRIEGINNVSEIFEEYGGIFAKTEKGDLYGWGYNGRGQLGIGKTEVKTSPICLNNLENIKLYKKKIDKLYQYANICFVISSDGKCFVRLVRPPT